MVTVQWRETAQGQALYIKSDGREVAFFGDDLENGTGPAAISLWEGTAGRLPSGRLDRWRWRRGLRRLGRAIDKAIAKEGEA